MHREVYLNHERIRLDPTCLLGQGGEAEVFDLRGRVTSALPLALKVWMPPDHPQFAGTDPDSERNRIAAASRIAEYGRKLREFPQHLPPEVVAPRELATDGRKDIVGYSMELVGGAEPLRVLGQRGFRTKQGIEVPSVLRLFRELHRVVDAVHRSGVVIGDFNYLNVLVRGEKPSLIDADSFQFGNWLCRSFTTRFVDPLICDGKAKLPVQVKPHSAATDWYAFALMLFECLMFVGPYGGVYRPSKKTALIPEDARPLKRISVFSPEVIFPQKAVPLTWLPKGVADFYGRLLHDDTRGIFPADLLERLLAHAEGRVHEPAVFAPTPGTQEVLRGSVRVRRMFSEGGTIERVAVHDGTLRVLLHKDGKYLREDGGAVVSMPRDPSLVTGISGRRTVLAKGDTLAVVTPGEPAQREQVELYQGRFPVFACNARHYYWVSQGMLKRDDTLAPAIVGTVLSHQTRIWVGSAFGFGYYRAGGVMTGFVFDAERLGLNDSVALPPLREEIIDAKCFFSSQRAWLFLTLKRGTEMVNRCMLIRPDGSASPIVEAPEGSDGWLGSIRGKCAATLPGPSGSSLHRLFSYTDQGVVGLEETPTGISEVVRYPDTLPFLEHDGALIADGKGSVLQVKKSDVWRLTFA